MVGTEIFCQAERTRMSAVMIGTYLFCLAEKARIFAAMIGTYLFCLAEISPSYCSNATCDPIPQQGCALG